AEEKIIEHRERLEAVQAQRLDRQAELRRHGPHQLVGAEHRGQDKGGGGLAGELFEHRAAERGLARADLAGGLHGAFGLANAVEQMIERLAMFRAVKQKPRVRRYVERRLRQAVILKVHARFLAGKVPGKRKESARGRPTIVHLLTFTTK